MVKHNRAGALQKHPLLLIRTQINDFLDLPGLPEVGDDVLPPLLPPQLAQHRVEEDESVVVAGEPVVGEDRVGQGHGGRLGGLLEHGDLHAPAAEQRHRGLELLQRLRA